MIQGRYWRRERARRFLASTYLGRYLAFNEPTDHDQSRMPQRRISASPQAAPTPKAARERDLSQLMVTPRRGAPQQPLSRLFTESGSTAIVVLHESVASALVGLAISEGAIDSVDAPIGRWLPDLQDPRARELTLAHLLEMRSGIRFTEGMFPWNDEPRTYYATDLRARLLGLPVVDPLAAFFPLQRLASALAFARPRACHRQDDYRTPATADLEPAGAEHPASIMVDRSGPSGLEHLECGLTATARDLAKFGQLFLQDGMWNGRRLLPARWVDSTTSPAAARSDAAWFDYYRERPWGRVLSTGRYFYGRMWWGNRLETGGYDFFAMGVLGQHVHVSPDTATVIVRLSSCFPPGMWWAPVLRAMALATAGRSD